MTIEEALLKVTDTEVRAFLQKVIDNQNSYATKLEAQVNELKKAPTNNQGVQGTDDITQKYIQDTMKRDITNQAIATLKGIYGEATVNACMNDYLEFLKANMTLKNTTIEYATDAFNLVFGRCFAKKDHPVHSIGKATSPSGTPTPAPIAGTNAEQVQQVASIIQGQPQVMTDRDTSAGQGVPGTQGVQIKNTRDAFSVFKDKLKQGGSSKFQ